jgi:hypothetical protein
MRWAVLFLALLGSGCADSNPYLPAGPSSVIPPLPAPQLSGQWGGGVFITAQGERLSGAVLVNLQQSGAALSGSWSNVGITTLGFYAGSGTGGTISGTVTPFGADLQFSGTVTWDSNNGACRGEGAFTAHTQNRDEVIVLIAPTLTMRGCLPIANFAINAALNYGTAR